jgi:hypothetical protein
MRKTLLGVAVTAAVDTPLALATTAQAATSTSTPPDCTPVTEVFAGDLQAHMDDKDKPAVGTGHINHGGLAVLRARLSDLHQQPVSRQLQVVADVS